MNEFMTILLWLGGNKQLAYVKDIYHAFLQTDEFEKTVFFQTLTVILSSARPLDLKHEHH